MKLKDFVSVTQNKRTKQIIFSLRVRELRKIGLTSKQLLEVVISKPKIKNVPGSKK